MVINIFLNTKPRVVTNLEIEQFYMMFSSAFSRANLYMGLRNVLKVDSAVLIIKSAEDLTYLTHVICEHFLQL